jgi:hypothetical protein
MSGYTIAAIPTLYRGRMYRSRLEARWAAFFDRLGWAHEYEPFDLGPWSPDFLLTDMSVLVEVKPATQFDPETSRKVIGALRRSGHERALMTFVAPKLEGNVAMLGIYVEGFEEEPETAFRPDVAMVGWLQHPDLPRFSAEIVSPCGADFGKGWATANGHAGGWGDDCAAPWPYGAYTMGLWADASNAVQWEPKS